MTNYLFKIIFCIAIMGTGTIYFAFADDLPSAKDPAAQAEPVRVAPKHPQVEPDKAEARFDFAKELKTCVEVLHESSTACKKKLMTECKKSMALDQCRQALR